MPIYGWKADTNSRAGMLAQQANAIVPVEESAGGPSNGKAERIRPFRVCDCGGRRASGRLWNSYRNCNLLGTKRPVVRFQQHMATGDQYGDDHCDVPDG